MSSLLWQHSKTWEYSFSTKPCIGDLQKQGIVLVRLGNFRHIKEKLQSYMFSQSFSKKQILREPAKWAAYFIFIYRELEIEMNTEYVVLYELLESIDPNIWVQNRDVVDLLLEGLIKYSRELCMS